MNNIYRFILSLFFLATFLLPPPAQSEEFDLAKIPSVKRISATPRQENQKDSQMYRININNSNKAFFAIGPYQAVQGEIEMGDDNLPRLPGGKLIGKDTGKTFGIALKGVYANGENENLIINLSSELFTKRTATAASMVDKKKLVTVNSTERERVSVKKMLFTDGYYLVAGAGAENLTDQGPVARDIQEAFHKAQWAKTKKIFKYVNGYGPTGLSADASLGIGKELISESGNVQVFMIPEMTVQVSTDGKNNELQLRSRLGARTSGTELSGYAEYDISSGRDASVVGVRLDQNIYGNKDNRTAFFVAVERTKGGPLDKWYGQENWLNKNIYFKIGLRKKIGPSTNSNLASGAQ